MSLKTRLSKLAVDAEADAIAKLLAGGWCEFMTGEPPSNVEQKDAGQILARCKFADVAFGKATDGVIVANRTEKTTAIRTGEPTWVRLTSASGQVVMDGNVGTSNANAVVKVKMLVEGQIVDITGARFAIPKTLNGA